MGHLAVDMGLGLQLEYPAWHCKRHHLSSLRLVAASGFAEEACSPWWGVKRLAALWESKCLATMSRQWQAATDL